jgi:prevent-host-death family protein
MTNMNPAMAQYNIAQAKAHFSELVERALLGEEIVIARDNRPLLRMVPIGIAQPRVPGSGKDAVLFISDDFDAPLEDFKDYS